MARPVGDGAQAKACLGDEGVAALTGRIDVGRPEDTLVERHGRVEGAEPEAERRVGVFLGLDRARLDGIKPCVLGLDPAVDVFVQRVDALRAAGKGFFGRFGGGLHHGRSGALRLRFRALLARRRGPPGHVRCGGLAVVRLEREEAGSVLRFLGHRACAHRAIGRQRNAACGIGPLRQTPDGGGVDFAAQRGVLCADRSAERREAERRQQDLAAGADERLPDRPLEWHRTFPCWRPARKL